MVFDVVCSEIITKYKSLNCLLKLKYKKTYQLTINYKKKLSLKNFNTAPKKIMQQR